MRIDEQYCAYRLTLMVEIVTRSLSLTYSSLCIKISAFKPVNAMTHNVAVLFATMAFNTDSMDFCTVMPDMRKPAAKNHDEQLTSVRTLIYINNVKLQL